MGNLISLLKEEKRQWGDCTKLWQHNRGNYTTPTIYQNKKKNEKFMTKNLSLELVSLGKSREIRGWIVVLSVP